MKLTSLEFAAWILPLVLALGSPMPLEAEDVSRTVQDGVYSKAQASRGRNAYQRLCRTCHETKEFEAGYMETWSGRTAFDLFDMLRTTMPEEAPGIGGSEGYTDIVAYMFRLSELPPGEEDMKSDEEALKLIRIEGPFGESDDP